MTVQTAKCQMTFHLFKSGRFSAGAKLNETVPGNRGSTVSGLKIIIAYQQRDKSQESATLVDEEPEKWPKTYKWRCGRDFKMTAY